MELDLLIEDYTVVFVIVLALAVILVALRVSGFDPKPSNPADSDPIEEADFHMAYGLYGKAAEAIRRAMLDDPASADLSLKLLEVYFVSGNGDEFLKQARFYKETFGRSGHWDRIRHMGQELLPDERLFR